MCGACWLEVPDLEEGSVGDTQMTRDDKAQVEARDQGEKSQAGPAVSSRAQGGGWRGAA
jgi:hypothetical protein